MRKSGASILFLIIAINAAIWIGLTRSEPMPSWSGVINGVSFQPYRGDQDPQVGEHPTPDQIGEDLSLLAPYTSRVRTYSIENVLSDVPYLAARRGLKVTLGAWIDRDRQRNADEVMGAIRLARQNPSVERVIVGNESLLRDDVTPEELIQYLRLVRRSVHQPVSTAEPWHVWLQYPELAKEVDFIGIHVLPYWEGVPVENALEHVLARYEEVSAAFPDKKVVITEVGWPSDGPQIGMAVPSRVNQAWFLRTFLNYAEDHGLDYYIMEAFDQPWKAGPEGSAGAYWGMFNSDREAKFAMDGAVKNLPQWAKWASITGLAASILILLLLRRVRGMGYGGQIFLMAVAQLASAVLVWALAVGSFKYLTLGSGILWTVMIGAQFFLLLMLLSDGFEIADVVWGRRRKREVPPAEPAELPTMPKVSIHVPIYNEPPEMVKQTLAALARLNYVNYEVLVVDNNTKDEAVWRPVEAFCAELGPKFRFFHLPSWPGFKAGALNFALQHTAPDAEVVGVIDSDYVVSPDWLSALVPHFQRPEVAIVQAPQDYRDGGDSALKRACYWEYAGFFNIGMVQRGLRNAIIQHGTMTLVRRDALDRVGGWAEWCICEDAELGLRLFKAGYHSVYVNRSFGRGLIPDSFMEYRKQRFRWAYGAVQILKRHWKSLLPFGLGRVLDRKNGAEGYLDSAQRYHFFAGWMPWLADGMGLIFTLLGLAWTVGLIVAPRYLEFPFQVFVVPTAGMFVFRMAHSLTLYRARVPCGVVQRLGALLAGLSLTHTISKAVLTGFVTSGKPFLRTAKCEDKPAFVQAIMMAWQEALLWFLLWAGIAGILIINGTTNDSALLWCLVLLAQSVPYAAAVAMAMLSVLPSRRREAIPASGAVQARARS